jgi:glutaredoxin
MKKIILAAAIIIAAGGLAFLIFRNKNENTQPVNVDRTGIILFYGDGCPHCVNVEKFIKDNNVEEKVSFQRLEVFSNKNNAALLQEFAAGCKILAENIGVPFLWDGANSTCIGGDADIISFFNSKIQ